MKDEYLMSREDWYQFYARLDHAIKNPLTTISICADNLRREHLSPEGQRSLDNLRDQALRLRKLVRSLRSVALLSTIEMEEEKLDIVEIVQIMLDAVREGPAAQEVYGGHPLTLHGAEEARERPAVVGDRDYLADAIYSVLDNACKFSAPGTPIDVWVQPEGDWLRIKVVDQGMGVAAEDLPHLGKELYRSVAAIGKPGDGLGLARLRVVLERHGGRFEVQSQVDEGTTVSLLLPLAR